MTFPRHLIARRVFNAPLMIVPEKLDVIIGAIWTDAAPSPQAEVYRRASEDRPYRVTNGNTAVIPICDTLVHRGSWIDAESGMASYEGIRQQLRAALADEEITGIILDIDSPGGEVAGCFDLADEIAAARGTKPILAVANEMAASAAYALGSAAERLFVTRTAMVGSIGVVAMHVDMSKFDEKMGVKYTPIYAGARKVDFSEHAPLGAEAKSLAQAEIDKTYDLFVQTVARNRRLDERAVRETEAAIYSGADAVKAGLADEVGTLQEAVGALARRNSKSTGSFMRAATDVLPSPAALAAPGVPARSVKQGNIMTDIKEPEAGAEQAEVIDIQKVREEAEAAGEARASARLSARATEIRDLCSLAGVSARAGEFIASQMSVADVRKALMEARAAADEKSVISGSHTSASPDALAKANNYGWDAIVAKAAKHRFATAQR